jgi:uncharacterized circularly permuted ATP-grasp superfamily protein
MSSSFLKILALVLTITAASPAVFSPAYAQDDGQRVLQKRVPDQPPTTVRAVRKPAKPSPAIQVAYDEVLNTDGTVREHYKWIWDIYQSLSPQRLQDFKEQAFKDFEGDNLLYPLPRVMPEVEFKQYQAGVSQRGRALHAFLTDFYSGAKTYQKENLIPEGVLKSILGRNYEAQVPNYLRNQPIHFWYGPDVIRDTDGNLRVVEDNTGFVGGMGDLVAARHILLKHIPEYGAALTPGHDPWDFYRELAESYKKRAQKYGGIPLLITYPKAISPDKEDSRVTEIFTSLGIKEIKVDPFKPQKGHSEVKIKADGMYLGNKKIGYVILDYDPSDIDPNHHLTEVQFANTSGWDAADSRNKMVGFPGFWDGYVRGKFGVDNGPGVEFVNDKQFYMYVESLIRFYLKEAPILRNLDTFSFADYDENGVPHLSEARFKKWRKNIDGFVTKPVNGRGGDGVQIGFRANLEARQTREAQIRSNPENYICQEVTSLSVADGMILDTRNLADISEDGAIVANVSWGRGTPADGDGLVNISGVGQQVPNVVIDVSRQCDHALGGDYNAEEEEWETYLGHS